MKEFQALISIIKDGFNILFFVIASLVAILTYLQAKKTLFSPLKTEVFKSQLKMFEEITSRFQNKSILDLENDYGTRSIIDLNSHIMLVAYIEKCFKGQVEVLDELREKIKETSVGGIVSFEKADKVFRPISLNHKPGDFNEFAGNEDEVKWNEYNHNVVALTKEFNEATKFIESHQNSPLLPTQLKKLLKDYNDVAVSNIMLIGDILTSISQELPEHFKEYEDLQNFSVSPISNIFNQKKKDMDIHAKNILDFINNHLNIDGILGK